MQFFYLISQCAIISLGNAPPQKQTFESCYYRPDVFPDAQLIVPNNER